MKKSQFIVFLTVVLSVYSAVNYYIFTTGLSAIPQNYRATYTAAYLFLFLSYIAGRFLERKFPNAVSTFFVWVGSFWLGAMVYYLLFTILIDLVRLANLVFRFLPAEFYSEEYKLLSFVLVNISVVLIVLSGYLNARIPVIKKLNITINKKAGELKNLKIAAASDIHLGTIIAKRSMRRIVEKINSIDADIVLLPGDVVDEDIGPVIKRNLGEFITNIKSKYGVFAITGNHEYIGGAEAACSYLEAHGIVELRDRYVKIAESFYVVGREDRASKGFAGILRKPMAELMSGIDSSLPVILMDHQPVHLNEAEKFGVDLQLSGHTHHGQLWPFNFITKKIYEVSMGYKKKGNTHIYVSCGVGSWGPPIRTGNRPEILEIDIQFKQ